MAPARVRTSRTFSMVAATIVPTFMPILLGDAAVADAPAALLVLADLGEAVVGAQRVAAVRHEVDDAIELVPRQSRVRRRIGDLVIKRVGVERRRAGHAEHVLGKHVERAGARHGRVLHTMGRGIDGGPALDHLEAVRGHQQRARGLVEPVVGPADALGDPARTLRRADIDDEVDVAPVDAEIERRGADHRLDRAGRHGGLDTAALGGIERTVMKRDRQVFGIVLPKVPEQLLGLEARVDEDQRQLGARRSPRRFRRAHAGRCGPAQGSRSRVSSMSISALAPSGAITRQPAARRRGWSR